MADPKANPSPGEDADWHRRESFGNAFVQILVAGAVLGGGLYFYYQRSQTKKEINSVGKEARELVARGNPKDLAAAKAKFEHALSLDPNDGFSTSSTALIEALMWTEYDATDHQAAAIEWTTKADDHGGNIDERFAAGALTRLGQGKVDEASSYLKAVTDRGGAGPGIFDALGLIKRAQNKLDESRALLKKAHDQGWRSAGFADDLADSYFDDGDYPNAQGFYEKGLESNSEHLRSQLGQARCRIARGINLLQASQALESVSAKQPAETAPKLRALASTGLAELRRFEQKYDEAIKLADTATASDPAFAWAYAVKGSALAATNQPSAAAAFDKAIATDPHVGVFYFDAARGMAKLKDGAKAEGYLTAYSKVLKTDDRFHVVYGDLMRDLGNTDKAISEYNEAIKANGLNAAAHFDLGVALIAKSDLDKATVELNAALGVQSTYPAARMALGGILFGKHNYEESLEQYAHALVDLKTLGAPRDQIDGLLEEVNQRLLKDKQKEIAKRWLDQGRLLVR